MTVAATVATNGQHDFGCILSETLFRRDAPKALRRFIALYRCVEKSAYSFRTLQLGVDLRVTIYTPADVACAQSMEQLLDAKQKWRRACRQAIG
jgi:hypothetical protein